MDDPIYRPRPQSRENIHNRAESGSASPQRARRQQRGPSQKAMLSKALQKANTAVLLDNAANFEGAIEAYQDACQLLQLVMVRSSGTDDEKSKLQEIRNTYTSRIKELERLDLSSQQSSGDKALPERPLSDQSLGPANSQSVGEIENQDATPTQANNFPHDNDTGASLPDRRKSLRPSAFDDGNTKASDFGPGQEEGFSKSQLVLDDGHFSEPFSPFAPQNATNRHSDVVPANSELYELAASKRPEPANGNDPTSWLNTIDESGTSSPVSTKSKLSMYSRTTGSRQGSNGTEAEFDAALDAAVEAAYNEGLEPAVNPVENAYDNGDDVVSNARRNIEIAKQRVREAEREAQEAMARGLEQRRMMDESAWLQDNSMELDYVGDEAEEEERILEEMTKGYVMDDFDLALHTKSALPRQSDSSNFSGRTWGSSVTSNPATAITSLSTLKEESAVPSGAAAMANKLPTVPQEQVAPLSPPSGARARRLSGANMKQLRIDTNRTHIHPQGPKTEPFTAPFRSPPPPVPQYEPLPNVPIPPPNTSKPLPSVVPDKRTSNESLKEDGYGTGLSRAVTQESDDFNHSLLSSPPKPTGKTPVPGILRKNTSSSSLGAMMARNASVSTPDILNESPNTPSSSTFPPLDFQRAVPNSFVPPLPTPTGAAFANGLPRGFYLFDNDIHSPSTPGAPNQSAVNAPLPLEPCPGSFLHRPFWLMRSLYQTIAHPRGGYLSTKLFVPREVWLVKNVKIRAMEDKISLCDLLTAALLKLAQVDTYDADAVLEEMQSFENMLDQAQSTFSKKLGNEVGVQASLPLFRSPTTTEEPSVVAENNIPRSSNSTSKSYLASWRKLRSKSSGTTTSGSYTPVPSSGRESGKEGLTMNTLPMTTSPSTRIVKRNVAQQQFTGPNANYMGALARLFDAAQVLDQIVRQVEDPGLKHSSPTHVGLELSTRHAAEFFGFYVCRFALNDLGLLLDKYIKRGSEWVSL
ncbi:Extracellular matrix-binding protein EbhA [Talaromyces islandicus]|uniref:Extracellular matrix-binding protein EbhA n=1 Tax=Talaromyces islandicus TaxID=28573 RepID=A0A0U1M4H3_TALIS|nr:Extracellular matrix-binding protein EbhA [Talaromyces islandicus]